MRKKVLIVEDSPLMHKLYELALRSYKNCELDSHFASDGHEGLIKLQEHPDTDLILLDVNMPLMSGLEFLRRVRAERVFDDIDVVLQSTEDQKEDIERGLEAGAMGYLTKPFTPEQLHELLDSVLLKSGEAADGD